MTENLDSLPGIARRREKERDKRKEESENYKGEYLLKICLIGSGFDLRAKFLSSFSKPSFPEGYVDTLGVDIFTSKISINNTLMKLILVNTAGQESFDQLRPNYYQGSSACIIVFDKSDRSSFNAVPDWLEEFRKHTSPPVPKITWVKGYKEVIKEASSIPIALLAINTKEEDVSSDEGQQLAEQLNLTYFETSSPKFENSKDIFEYLSREVIRSN